MFLTKQGGNIQKRILLDLKLAEELAAKKHLEMLNAQYEAALDREVKEWFKKEMDALKEYQKTDECKQWLAKMTSHTCDMSKGPGGRFMKGSRPED